ncbi:hypothetical protein Tco_0737278 [Tanacetum coccineum]
MTQLEVVLSYLVLVYYEVTPSDIILLRPNLWVLQIEAASQSLEQAPPSPNYVPGLEYPDPEEDPEEDPTDYPADGGDDDEEEEASEDDEDEESEHLALANSTALPAIDLVPSTCLCKARKTIRPQPPMAASTEALDTVDAVFESTLRERMTAIDMGLNFSRVEPGYGGPQIRQTEGFSVLQRQRSEDGDRLPWHIIYEHDKLEMQMSDGPDDAGS